MTLQPGEPSQPITISSTEKWVHTGINLQPDASYTITAAGRWIDKTYDCTADGYDSPNLVLKLAEGFRRAPKARWFALIGTIDGQMASAFVIGERCTVSGKGPGELVCFANDVPGFYGNNKGSVRIVITRLS